MVAISQRSIPKDQLHENRADQGITVHVLNTAKILRVFFLVHALQQAAPRAASTLLSCFANSRVS